MSNILKDIAERKKERGHERYEVATTENIRYAKTFCAFFGKIQYSFKNKQKY